MRHLLIEVLISSTEIFQAKWNDALPSQNVEAPKRFGLPRACTYKNEIIFHPSLFFPMSLVTKVKNFERCSGHICWSPMKPCFTAFTPLNIKFHHCSPRKTSTANVAKPIKHLRNLKAHWVPEDHVLSDVSENNKHLTKVQVAYAKTWESWIHKRWRLFKLSNMQLASHCLARDDVEHLAHNSQLSAV